MKRQFSACQTPRSMCPSIFNSFPVIWTASPKISPFSRTAAHIFVSPGDAPGAITLNVVWMEREFDAYICLAACAHLTITVSEIERDIGRKSLFFHTPLHLTPPLGGFPSEYRHPVWYRKTRMAWLPIVKKFRRYLYSFWRNSRTWQTDTHTHRHCMPT